MSCPGRPLCYQDLGEEAPYPQLFRGLSESRHKKSFETMPLICLISSMFYILNLPGMPKCPSVLPSFCSVDAENPWKKVPGDPRSNSKLAAALDWSLLRHGTFGNRWAWDFGSQRLCEYLTPFLPTMPKIKSSRPISATGFAYGTLKIHLRTCAISTAASKATITIQRANIISLQEWKYHCNIMFETWCWFITCDQLHYNFTTTMVSFAASLYQ